MVMIGTGVVRGGEYHEHDREVERLSPVVMMDEDEVVERGVDDHVLEVQRKVGTLQGIVCRQARVEEELIRALGRLTKKVEVLTKRQEQLDTAAHWILDKVNGVLGDETEATEERDTDVLVRFVQTLERIKSTEGYRTIADLVQRAINDGLLDEIPGMLQSLVSALTDTSGDPSSSTGPEEK
jgi:hypothetical protein